ncbi:hypothetical protein NDU88_004650 [Pleurodeles waltl]|uniref:NADH dehydrogenase [ubiquinone] 1 subunit C1, mitochondrial n=1 Tax=Pleurodeles waltl TaxID=8319 RepID=A0AAV7WSZ2_PLEWA|nr:hypothetical protein NDU88_004650 [Pleurodeles waltl]
MSKCGASSRSGKLKPRRLPIRSTKILRTINVSNYRGSPEIPYENLGNCAVPWFRSALTRSAYTARRHDPNKPNWLRVGLALGSTAALWILLFRQHAEHVADYKRLNGIE